MRSSAFTGGQPQTAFEEFTPREPDLYSGYLNRSSVICSSSLQRNASGSAYRFCFLVLAGIAFVALRTLDVIGLGMHFRDQAVFHKGTDKDTITRLACL